VRYRDVTLRWWTHTAGGVTDRDRDLAARSDALA
jgi:pterin-4a-carbinolamine dehydratase